MAAGALLGCAATLSLRGSALGAVTLLAGTSRCYAGKNSQLTHSAPPQLLDPRILSVRRELSLPRRCDASRVVDLLQRGAPDDSSRLSSRREELRNGRRARRRQCAGLWPARTVPGGCRHAEHRSHCNGLRAGSRLSFGGFLPRAEQGLRNRGGRSGLHRPREGWPLGGWRRLRAGAEPAGDL